MSWIFFYIITDGVASLFLITAKYSIVKRYQNLLLGFQWFLVFYFPNKICNEHPYLDKS